MGLKKQDNRYLKSFMALSGVIRVVLDANVIFSGCAFNSGNPRSILDLVAKHEVCLIINEYIIEEVVNHLKEKNKGESIPWFYSFLNSAFIEMVGTPSRQQVNDTLHLVPNDPKDVPIVLTAINSNADYLISGDKHLNAHDVSTRLIDRITTILTPKEFFDNFENPHLSKSQ